ncbi:threonine dehydratase [Echinicola strongylocentroti]|uniref:L-threonine dehydratase n=1 Tax=Echinicola strongylocentroti TaxID=1795355 RepID=A0A2Z4IEQ4_9BACT|nr:threonine ammonia-lyase IlvA [Echinicola strongylocentroti]AWW28923.1 threonine dehydratase [Echinicola strongylocentroti]
MNQVSFQGIIEASEALKEVLNTTPLQYNEQLSEEYGCHVYLKREDLQAVRSYKIRGAYHKISSLSEEEKERGVVCASAGNHAQGVAFACKKLGIKGTIFIPSTTPAQKINRMKLFGKEMVEIVLSGDTYDDAYLTAAAYCEEKGAVFVHPFDDTKVIEGQGTIAKEMLDDADFPIDYLFLPIGGGGMAAGVSTYFKKTSPETKLIGTEPKGAPSMLTSIQNLKNTVLDEIDGFVDGAAVKKVGNIPFEICRKNLDEMLLVPEGRICTTILNLYNNEGIVVEPAGAMTLAALSLYDKDKLKGKNVVCVVSGGNNDIMRTAEIKERSLLYEGLKHYFMIQFPQRPGALKDFVSKILGPNDDIAYFQFAKKNNRENGPAVVGIELKNPDHITGIFDRLKENRFKYNYLNENLDLLTLLM